jgi:hypothetical protein
MTVLRALRRIEGGVCGVIEPSVRFGAVEFDCKALYVLHTCGRIRENVCFVIEMERMVSRGAMAGINMEGHDHD